ncbi:MFS transporter [Dactylosporangium darangshiense]|uniref:MFS transporter n=1 Tax=Dactylosporangium darangshiense TaxID=579108 RepID=UPI003629F377
MAKRTIEASRNAAAPKRVVLAALVGTSLEWYDFFLYGSAAALVFGKLFFPSFASVTATLLAFATYAVGFVARPLGGIVFGHFGDRVGRKGVLVVTLVLMGARRSPSGCCRRMRPGEPRRRCCWSRCGSCKGSGSAASGAGPW